MEISPRKICLNLPFPVLLLQKIPQMMKKGIARIQMYPHQSKIYHLQKNQRDMKGNENGQGNFWKVNIQKDLRRT